MHKGSPTLPYLMAFSTFLNLKKKINSTDRQIDKQRNASIQERSLVKIHRKFVKLSPLDVHYLKSFRFTRDYSQIFIYDFLYNKRVGQYLQSCSVQSQRKKIAHQTRFTEYDSHQQLYTIFSVSQLTNSISFVWNQTY